MSKLRVALACLLAVLPARMRRRLGMLVLGWDVHPTAYIGHSILVADKVTLGPGAWIGSGNLIRGLSELRLDADAGINSLNSISGLATSTGAFPGSPHRHPALIMKVASSIQSRHVIDCSDTVTFEDFASLAGIRSTIFTHSVDLVRNQQRTGRVTVGERAAVLSNSVLLAGTAVPPRSLVSAGSVVNTVLTKEYAFYRGNPAVEVRELPASLAYFRRTEAGID